MNKEKWIEATLHSADSMDRAKAPDLVARVEARLGSRQVTMTISTGTLWRIAASVALLIALNIATLTSHPDTGSAHTGHMHGPEALFGLPGTSHQADIGDLFFGSEMMNNE